MSEDPHKPNDDASDSTGENDETQASGAASPDSGDEPTGETSSVASSPPPAGESQSGFDALSNDDKLWAMLVHLAGLAGYIPIIPAIGMVIGPLLVWAIKKNDMPFVHQQGKEALNFQLTVLIAVLVLTAISLIPFAVCLTAPVGIVLVIGHVVLTIIGAIQANDGKPYVYPFRIQFFT